MKRTTQIKKTGGRQKIFRDTFDSRLGLLNRDESNEEVVWNHSTYSSVPN